MWGVNAHGSDCRDFSIEELRMSVKVIASILMISVLGDLSDSSTVFISRKCDEYCTLRSIWY